MSIKDYYFGVTPIQPFNGEKYTFATGFFYENEEHIYLITNRHVVIDEKKDHYPKAVKIIIHSSPTRPRVVREVHIPLYDDDMNPMWLEYAHIESTFIDIIAINIQNVLQKTDILHRWSYNDMASRGQIYTHDTLRVLGYPMGFHDTIHNIPIARHATIASPYTVAFQNEPYYLIDANLHEGMSGSPVIAPDSFLRVKNQRMVHSLLGIHSGGWEDKESGTDLGLGVVWFPHLIHEIISCA